jgi:hypothetical protein
MTVQDVQTVQSLRELALSQAEGFKPPSFILPRVRGGGKRWGMEQLDGLNVWNFKKI